MDGSEEIGVGQFEIVELTPRVAASVRGEVPPEQLPDFFGRAFGLVMEALQSAGPTVDGPPFGFYPTMPSDVVVVEAGFPTSARIEPAGEVHALELPGGRAVVGMHVGSYDTLEQTYDRLKSWAQERGEAVADAMWESYLSDPSSEPDPATWRTRIVWPLRDRHR